MAKRVAADVPDNWGEAMDRLAATGYYRVNRITKADMIRAGLRLYLQYKMSPKEWEDLDLGMPMEDLPEPPSPVIDSTCEEIPLTDPDFLRLPDAASRY